MPLKAESRFYFWPPGHQRGMESDRLPGWDPVSSLS
jgi:hypothetical protein